MEAITVSHLLKNQCTAAILGSLGREFISAAEKTQWRQCGHSAVFVSRDTPSTHSLTLMAVPEKTRDVLLLSAFKGREKKKSVCFSFRLSRRGRCCAPYSEHMGMG